MPQEIKATETLNKKRNIKERFLAHQAIIQYGVTRRNINTVIWTQRNGKPQTAMAMGFRVSRDHYIIT